MALCRPVMASMSVALPLSSSYRVRPPPRDAIHTLLSGASANAVTSLSPSQAGRCPPSSQLRGFQRLTPPARVPIHTRPVSSWYSDMTKESRNERSEEHTSELQSPCNLVCRLLLEKKVEVDDVGREALGRDLEGGACARRGLEEQIEHALAAQQRYFLHLALGDADEGFRRVEDLHQHLARQAFDGQQVLQLAVGVELGVTLHARARGRGSACRRRRASAAGACRKAPRRARRSAGRRSAAACRPGRRGPPAKCSPGGRSRTARSSQRAPCGRCKARHRPAADPGR